MIVCIWEETAFKMTTQISGVARIVHQWKVTDIKVGQTETL